MCFLDVVSVCNVYSGVLILSSLYYSVIQNVVLDFGLILKYYDYWNIFLECQQLGSKRQYFSEA